MRHILFWLMLSMSNQASATNPAPKRLQTLIGSDRWAAKVTGLLLFPLRHREVPPAGGDSRISDLNTHWPAFKIYVIQTIQYIIHILKILSLMNTWHINKNVHNSLLQNCYYKPHLINSLLGKVTGITWQRFSPRSDFDIFLNCSNYTENFNIIKLKEQRMKSRYTIIIIYTDRAWPITDKIRAANPAHSVTP